jgi:hypothetical protein
MTDHQVLPRPEWIEARRRFLAKEKEFTRLREELSRERRELPWERVEKNYVFDGHTPTCNQSGGVRGVEPGCTRSPTEVCCEPRLGVSHGESHGKHFRAGHGVSHGYPLAPGDVCVQA